MTAINKEAREARLRRLAKRHGYRVVKSRARDPWAIGYGRYGIVDVELSAWIRDLEAYSLDLDGVEKFLSGLDQS